METNPSISSVQENLAEESLSSLIAVPNSKPLYAQEGFFKFIAAIILILFPIGLFLGGSYDPGMPYMAILLGPFCFIAAIFIALSPNSKKKGQIQKTAMTRSGIKSVILKLSLFIIGFFAIPLLLDKLSGIFNFPSESSELLSFPLILALGLILFATGLFHKTTDSPTKSTVKILAITLVAILVAVGAAFVFFIALI